MTTTSPETRQFEIPNLDAARANRATIQEVVEEEGAVCLHGLVEPEFCVNGPQAGVYTLSRVHQYPTGGGFLKSHVDATAAAVPGHADLEGFVQVLMVMSERGTDFEAGGGYYVRDGRRVLYEQETQTGDVLIYNGRTLHGVQAIDPHLPANLASAAGRYTGLVTLYRVREGTMSMG
jgi:hypothetical protein